MTVHSVGRPKRSNSPSLPAKCHWMTVKLLLQEMHSNSLNNFAAMSEPCKDAIGHAAERKAAAPRARTAQ